MECKKCGLDKDETEFNETSLGAKIKRITTCKSCQSIYNAADYQKRKNIRENLESIKKT